jgi:hypothetical protein
VVFLVAYQLSQGLEFLATRNAFVVVVLTLQELVTCEFFRIEKFLFASVTLAGNVLWLGIVRIFMCALVKFVFVLAQIDLFTSKTWIEFFRCIVTHLKVLMQLENVAEPKAAVRTMVCVWGVLPKDMLAQSYCTFCQLKIIFDYFSLGFFIINSFFRK